MLIGSGPGPFGGGVMGRLLRIATSTSISGATTTAGFGGEAISTESGDVAKGGPYTRPSKKYRSLGNVLRS